MMKRRTWSWSCALQLALASILASCVGAAAPAGGPARSSVPLSDCRLAVTGQPDRIPAVCGTVQVYENREAQAGRQIDLSIAVVRAPSPRPEPDPIFFLAGGPGQSALESFVPLANAFDRIVVNRDVVLVDQRGTGKSNPLRCPEPAGVDLEALGTAQRASLLRQCLERLDADPRHYATTVAMHDLDQVRAALGYDKINLYGISYGTRAALTYLRYYPTRVRSLVLDGVAPPDVVVGATAAQDAERALDHLLERCAADTACRGAFPDLRSDLVALADRLEREPVSVTAAHPISGKATSVRMTRERLAGTVRLLTYASETAAILPLLIHSAHVTGDLRNLVAQSLLATEELNEAVAAGMYLSVLCSEDAPFLTADITSPKVGFYASDRTIPELLESCAVWPKGSIPSDLRQPVQSDAPALLLSGEADPVTPPANAERALRTLTNGRHLVAPGQGHNVVFRGCLPRLVATFVESATATNLETDCVKDVRALPFFVSFAGPLP
ncbi:MAG: alpha/beta fold hydrolase [Chloroflexi bacterium]|nr:alpha/beta fold hydrolase [Chloroflexota bacterium]